MRVKSSATIERPIAVTGTAWRGTALAGLGVLGFSVTLPATEFALRGFDPSLVGVGRAAVAGAIALLCLLAAGGPVLPPRRHLHLYTVIALGIVFGFPVLTGLALALGANSAHGAVVVGLLPAATAVLAVLRAGERQGPLFWTACAAGAASITAFTLYRGGGHFTGADLLLFAAMLAAAAGYTEGGRLSKETPGWRVVSYALVVSLPVTVPVTVVLSLTTEITPSAPAVAGFAYVSVVSMFLAFIPWYAGLGLGGIARAGQIQLGQPILTLAWSWLLLALPIGWETVAGALAVLVCVAVTQRSRA
ncbi:DMT family transporter [Spongiactinospora sp. TRM90649]|uniref:DMT family transporter n=1 Tax=Spongiactinospora sp. TRM90649 TaxID=3031114 RepID=UPI0023F7E566|nr:DMT family transporter [Spongiactinospora sp. TRM90649]MDF5754005.1 DMT family transporter [Spongiactinospora sp. TRM90649]